MAVATWSFLLFPKLRYPATFTPSASVASCSSCWWKSSVPELGFEFGVYPERKLRILFPTGRLTAPDSTKESMCAMFTATT